MREQILSFPRAMTPQDVAKFVPQSPETIRRKAKAGLLKRVSGVGKVCFDPLVIADYYFPATSSLTIKTHKSLKDSIPSGKGVFKCL